MRPADRGRDAIRQNPLPGRQLAERLIKVHSSGAGRSPSPAAAAVAAVDNLYGELSRWFGRDGCHALFARALAQARNDYPALEKIQLRPGAEQYFDGASDAIETHGDATAAESIEAMLAALIDLLGRLIGYDMVTKLIESRREAAGPAGRMEIAR
jgi:hypothetical protein